MKLKKMLFTPFALALATVGFGAVKSMCLSWHYKPEIPEELK